MEGPPAIPRDAEYGLVSQFWRKAMEKDAGKRLTDQNHEQDYVHKEIRDNFFHGLASPLLVPVHRSVIYC